MSAQPIGLLLAAGLGTRFDPSGQRLKLLEPVASGPRAGLPMALAAARPLLDVLSQVFAVVRPPEHPHQRALHQLLESAGCRLVICSQAAEGMGTSLSCGVRASSASNATGWLIALADMPSIEHKTVEAVIAALADGHLTAAPFFRGVRGHPVSFASQCRDALLELEGDAGARAVLERHPPYQIEVDDAGAIHDLDFPNA
jgi:molybdenum cofactor cytidylyltransferase